MLGYFDRLLVMAALRWALGLPSDVFSGFILVLLAVMFALLPWYAFLVALLSLMYFVSTARTSAK